MGAHGGYIIMKRIPPDAKEVSLYVTYFWDRLKPSPALPGQPSAEVINLDKQPRYFARRELLAIKCGEDLVAWADNWIDADDWRRARCGALIVSSQDGRQHIRLDPCGGAQDAFGL